MSIQPQSTLESSKESSNSISFDPTIVATNSTTSPQNQPILNRRPTKSTFNCPTPNEKRPRLSSGLSSFLNRRRSEYYDDNDEFHDGCCGS
ncbi:2956_t:CDS:1, partial [Scutellospora calospora]